MNDDKLRDLFARLPRRGARPGFSARVRARIQREMRDGERARRHLTAVLAPTVAGLILVALIAWWITGGSNPFPGIEDTVTASGAAAHQQRARDRLKALRRERDELEKQIARVRTLLAEASPVVYLGGTDHFDLVLDLSKPDPRFSAAETAAAGWRRDRPPTLKN